MAFNELLADRIRIVLKSRKVHFREKKMMGGLTFMVDEKMCVGIIKEDLMVRMDLEIYEKALEKENCRKMDFTGRPLKGYVMISPEGVDMDSDLEYWINLALEYNPMAKSSKKKK